MIRIQRQRTKGWKMPANAVYVGRPTQWGNPYPIGARISEPTLHRRTRHESLQAYAGWLELNIEDFPNFLEPLKGKDLVCWCSLEEPCHADILLKKLMN